MQEVYKEQGLPLPAGTQEPREEAPSGYWASCCSFVSSAASSAATAISSAASTCASFITVNAAAAAEGTANAAKAIYHSPTTHPNVYKWYTLGYEFLSSPWNGWALAQAIDAFKNTAGQAKFLGATISSLIACTILTTFTGFCASQLHRYTNEHYGEGFHHETMNPADMSYAMRAYLAMLVIGDFLDHTLGDVSTWILWLELIRPDSSLLFKRIMYALIIAGSGLNTVKEWSVCVKNVLTYYFGSIFGEAEDVKLSPLVVYTMLWSFATAMINGYSIGLLLDALIVLSPVAAGLSIPGITVWALFGILPAMGSTFSHFFQYMSYDQHGGFSHEDYELSLGGNALIVVAKILDFCAHFEDYFATPAQLISIGLLAAKVAPHWQALTLIAFGLFTAAACVSETGVCFKEVKEGVTKLCAKFGIFQQPPEPILNTRTYEPVTADQEPRLESHAYAMV